MEHRCEGAKVCGLCQFWDGERELVRGSRPLRVKCETGSQPCKLRHFSCLSSSTTAGSCKQFKKWCELPWAGADFTSGVLQNFSILQHSFWILLRFEPRFPSKTGFENLNRWKKADFCLIVFASENENQGGEMSTTLLQNTQKIRGVQYQRFEYCKKMVHP